MVFSSPLFLFLFLPVVLGLYFVVPWSLRNAMLLVASIFFYAWGERAFALVMLGSTTLNYFFGLLVDRFRGGRHGKLVLGGAIAVNLGLLIAYKYANFIVANLNSLSTTFHFAPINLAPVHLPIGISFFTFHSLSYVIDIYRGDARVQKNPLDIGLYIALFPQLIAGPILRYHEMDDQIRRRRVTLDGFALGVRRFIIGLAKKVLIANTLAVTVDKIYALPATELTASLCWLAIVAYSLQIYFDFSGYSDMAIGLGRMFGFKFAENFNYPYISRSIREFWRRWHISLSTWFRDYLYRPIGGNRCSKPREYANLLTVFFLCGLWHGASWCFVAWGLFHGFFLVLERLQMMRWLERMWTPLRHASTLLVVMVGWVLFRAETFPKALAHLRAIAGFGSGSGEAHYAGLYLDNITVLALAAGAVGSTPIAPWLAARLAAFTTRPASGTSAIEAILRVGRLAMLAALFLLCAIQLAAGTYNPFIYFRF